MTAAERTILSSAPVAPMIPQEREHPSLEPRWRPAARWVVAVTTGGGLALLVWSLLPRSLSVTTDVVGRTTFVAFDIYRALHGFELLTLAFPLAAAAIYVLLAWRGPLACRHRRPRPWPPQLVEATDVDVDVDEPDRPPRPTVASVAWSLGRIALPATGVGLAAGIARTPRAQLLTQPAYGAAAAYILGVVLLGGALHRSRRLRMSRAQGPDLDLVTSLSTANAWAVPVLVPLLYLVSRSTWVRVISDHHMVRYSWLPLWLAVVLFAAAVALLAHSLVTQRRTGSTSLAEHRMLVGVAGPVLIFLATATLSGAVSGFSGFDDSQSAVGAQLLFHDGLWPWRNVMLLHGIYGDALVAQLGFATFGHTFWGQDNAVTLLVGPLTLVSYYTFAAYFARRNRVLVLVVAAAAAFGFWAPQPWSFRLVFLPPLLVLFDRVLLSGTPWRCGVLMLGVVVSSILTPEMALVSLAVLAALVAAEVVHKERRTTLLRALQRTRWCAAWGAGLVLAWVVFLAATGSLAGFLDYFRTTASGRELLGAYGITWSLTGDLRHTAEMVVPVVLYLLTAWRVATKLRGRTPWTTHDWVLVACTLVVPLYFQKFMDRADNFHVEEVFAAALPLVILWFIEGASVAELALRRGLARVRRLRALGFRLPASVAIGVAVVLVLPQSPSVLRHRPAAFHVRVPADPPTGVPRLGYTTPGTVDLAQITDLRAVLDRYAGPKAPVYDFVNEMGLTYFLLGRVPGARFYHVEAAQTRLAQQLVVSDLERSRPPVVIFNDTTFGLPDYDGIWSEERNYDVSQYILDNYLPLLDTHGQLVMIRSDLAGRAPSPPPLTTPPLTTGLYFTGPSCDWGDAPNFLAEPDAAGGPRLALRSGPASISAPHVEVRTLVVPRGTDLAGYRWLELRSSARLPNASFLLADGGNFAAGHTIAWHTLRRGGHRVLVPVGSCLQWHGYGSGTLTLAQTGGAESNVSLSLVR